MYIELPNIRQHIKRNRHLELELVFASLSQQERSQIDVMTRTKIIIGVIIAIIVIPLAVYTVSPLFVSTEVNEPLPVLASAQFSEVYEFDRRR